MEQVHSHQPRSPERNIEPITLNEWESRILKARQHMEHDRLDAIILEPGSNLYYFTGVRWDLSDRLMVAIIPAQGPLAYVCPGFEEGRLREKLLLGDDVRVWQEHENPYSVIADVLRDRGVERGCIGVEDALRFSVYDGIRTAAPQATLSAASRVTIGCRSTKSDAELALMQHAFDLTIEAFKACVSQLREGMSREEFIDNSVSAHRALGVAGSIDVQFGLATSFPHGSKESTGLRENDVVLMDGGCTVEGYHSDMTRTIVFGEPTKRQREIWSLEQEAQAAAFRAAKLGVPIESVDAAARKVIVDAGLGPEYKVPGLPHRTGHGIGLDMHEAPYVVRGNETRLEPGMCFSNEPMIVIPGQFGIRLEDCLYMTNSGARYFITPSPSIDEPFAE